MAFVQTENVLFPEFQSAIYTQYNITGQKWYKKISNVLCQKNEAKTWLINVQTKVLKCYYTDMTKSRRASFKRMLRKTYTAVPLF